ncbi:Tat proofreading chaperone DmsD [Leminorella grimontii]|uniref:Tat proofreading chaperone DmsD n=1 Tax=Leminorella grimontii TaxID=82981 RepID=UPI0008FEEBFE|nr:Tat proofreading chaperone DmsD [Leminorella grimontii]VFS59679.1 Twin-arginine leader-binding protein DmsD [Leminorella grimontii]
MGISIADRLALIKYSGRILGSLFLYSPCSEGNREIISFIASHNWICDWPERNKCIDRYASRLTSSLEYQGETRDAAYNRLFIGPGTLIVPPWGSVWLDKDCVNFGYSTYELRNWMDVKGIAYPRKDAEPEDHLGLLLLLGSWLADQNDETGLSELMSFHLLPWAFHYLHCLTIHANHPFYSSLSELTNETLRLWLRGNPVPVRNQKIYFSIRGER